MQYVVSCILVSDIEGEDVKQKNHTLQGDYYFKLSD